MGKSRPKLIRTVNDRKYWVKGNIYLISEGLACPNSITNGTEVYIYVLANFMGCQSPNVYYISQNQPLTRWFNTRRCVQHKGTRIMATLLWLH